MWGFIEKMPDKRLAILFALAIPLAILVFFLPVFLFNNYQVISRGEKHYTDMEVSRVVSILQNEIDNLDLSLNDWSSSDDTYQFAQDQNQDYIDHNLGNDSVVILEIDIFLILDVKNEVVYLKYVDRASGVEAPLPFDIHDLLEKYPALTSSIGLGAAKKGIAYIESYPVLVAMRPVLTSLHEGPPTGSLIWIRLLDEKEQAEISQLLQRNVAFFPAGSLPAAVADLPEPDVLKDQIFVQAPNPQFVYGYTYLRDLKGEPVLVMQVENPRDLFLQGRSAVVIFSAALLFLGVLLFGGSYQIIRSLLASRRTSRMYLERFRTIIHQSRESILLVGSDCQILEANPASRELLGWDPGEDPSPCLRSLITFEPDLNHGLIDEICQSGKVSEHRAVLRDGHELDVELTASPIEAPGVRAYSLILRDVTIRKKSRDALKASEERYMLAARGANDGLWDWNLLTGQVHYSDRWMAMLGCTENEIAPNSEAWFDRVHPDDLLQLQKEISVHLRDHSSNIECEHRIMHKDGGYRWMLARGVAVWNPAGYAYRIAGSLTDITRQKKLEEQLRFDALHDGLTGLGNRTLLIDRLHHINERKHRNPDLVFALLFLDLDRFKNINDSFGHQAGDQLLIEASHRLNLGMRATDTLSRLTGPETIARIAGDEFVILLEDFRSPEDVFNVAGRIMRMLGMPFHIAGQEVTLTVSIGIAIPQQAYANSEDIIRDADIAMYRAKELGGARVIQFDQEMYQATITRMQLERDIRKAVERKEFEVYYQPIFTLNDNEIAGFEALVRWNHPQRGFLLPGEFIQTAEDIGMIIPIGYYVLEEACTKMQAWQKKHHISPDLMISINFSVRQMLCADLVDRIRDILRKTGFDPKKLWLEVTEGALLEKNEEVLERLRALRALGIRIEIDDFGTGYSSLSYLHNLPVDGFKIDRSFIKDIQEGGHRIIPTLIELGRSLGLTEVAEGVETESQLEYLKSLSCQYGQGFLMSRPVSAPGIEEMLARLNEAGRQERPVGLARR